MPVFQASDEEQTTIHHPSWDEDEVVVLRCPTYASEKKAQGKAIKLPDGMSPIQLRSMPEDELERLLMESTDAAAVDLEMLRYCIVSWTLRRAPTKEQRQKGERGDLMTLSAGAIAALPPAAGEYIREQIELLRDSAPPIEMVGPKGDDFRNHVPPPGQRQLSRPRESPGKADTIRSQVG